MTVFPKLSSNQNRIARRNALRVEHQIPFDPKIEHEIVLLCVRAYANSTAWVNVLATSRRFVLVDVAKYTNPTFYFECVLRGLSGNPTSVRLYNRTDGVVVAGSVMTETGTVVVRRRTSALTLSGVKEYEVQIKNDVTASTLDVLMTVRIIVVDSSVAMTKTEHFHNIHNYPTSTTSATPIIPPFTFRYLFEGTKFDGSLTIYFEVCGYVSAKTGYWELYNYTDGVAVAGSTVSTTSTNPVRLRSGAITLTSGKEYIVRFWNITSGKTTYLAGAGLVIYQQRTEGITKAQSLKTTIRGASTTSTTYDCLWNDQLAYLDVGNYEGYGITFCHEVAMRTTNAAYPAYAILRNHTDGVYISDSELSTDSTLLIPYVRLRSTPITLASLKEYVTCIRLAVTAPTTTLCYIAGARIIIDLILVVVVIETITAKNFPMLYLEKPIKAQELKSKVEGATITSIAKDFPELLLKKGKAQELRSKWT